MEKEGLMSKQYYNCLKIINGFLNRDCLYCSFTSNLHLQGRTQENLGFLTVFESLFFLPNDKHGGLEFQQTFEQISLNK